jgi:hypothetical protein
MSNGACSIDSTTTFFVFLCALVTSICNIDKTNMENDCAVTNLEDKYTFKFKEKQKKW